MDAATLYMIATMPNGEMRARAYTQESASYCFEHQQNTREILSWCVSDSWSWINIAH